MPPRKRVQKPIQDPTPTQTEQPFPPVNESFTISNSSTDKPIPCLRSTPPKWPTTLPPAPSLIFTHGASGTLSAPAMVHFTKGYATYLPLLSFQGSMNLASRTKLFHAVVDSEREREGGLEKGIGLGLGGRSMGARAAVIAATESAPKDIEYLVLVSYPLTSPTGAVRDKILLDLPPSISVLFVSGDRDSMSDIKELNRVRLKMRAQSWLVTVKGADHGMGIKGKNSKRATEEVGVETGRVAAQWVGNLGEEGFGGEGRSECVVLWDAEKDEALVSDWTGKGAGFGAGIVDAEGGDTQGETKRTTSSKKRKAVSDPEEVSPKGGKGETQRATTSTKHERKSVKSEGAEQEPEPGQQDEHDEEDIRKKVGGKMQGSKSSAKSQEKGAKAQRKSGSAAENRPLTRSSKRIRKAD